MKETSQIDWARLAAYIDGEGCIDALQAQRKRRDGKPSHAFILRLSVHNTDPRLALWCHETAGAGHVHVDPRPSKKDGYVRRPMFSWFACNKIAETVLRNCLPYSVIKREQMEVALALRDTFAITRYKGPRPVTQDMLRYRLDLCAKLKKLKVELPVPTPSVATAETIQ
jgi:hypothetical protein